MKPERRLVAERALARHCPELLCAGPPPVDPIPALAALGARLAPALGQRLAPLSGGAEPQVEAGSAQACTGDDLLFDFPALAACSLYDIPGQGNPLLVAIEAQAVFRLVDRAFGGSGTAPEPLPAAFPLSADLMIGKLEAIVAGALGMALGTALPDCIRRAHGIDRLGAFEAQEPLVSCAFTVHEASASWRIVVAMPQSMASALVSNEARPHRPPSPARNAIDSLAGSMGELPLTLRAVLVDMRMPVSALAALVPGQVIPVSVARSVPLSVGGKAIASGTIGTQDDRVAVQVSQIFAKDES